MVVEAVGARHLQLAEETLRHPLLLDRLLLRRRQLLRLHFLDRLRVPAEKEEGRNGVIAAGLRVRVSGACAVSPRRVRCALVFERGHLAVNSLLVLRPPARLGVRLPSLQTGGAQPVVPRAQDSIRHLLFGGVLGWRWWW